MAVPFLKREPAILDLTRMALLESALARELCLLTLLPAEAAFCRSEIEHDLPSLLLVDNVLPCDRTVSPSSEAAQNSHWIQH